MSIFRIMSSVEHGVADLYKEKRICDQRLLPTAKDIPDYPLGMLQDESCPFRMLRRYNSIGVKGLPDQPGLREGESQCCLYT